MGDNEGDGLTTRREGRLSAWAEDDTPPEAETEEIDAADDEESEVGEGRAAVGDSETVDGVCDGDGGC